MPLMDINNPAIIIFLIENYEKENRLRLNWINKHKESIYAAATLTREPKNYYERDVIAYNMAGGIATITRDHIVAGYNRRRVAIRDVKHIPGIETLRHGHSIVDIGLGDPEKDPRLKRPETDTSSDPIMRPVSPKMKKIIYKPKPEFGRLQYMNKRIKEKPENKYYFPECSSYVYGWRLKDSGFNQRPSHPRFSHLIKSLRTRVGPQPDPRHYKSSDLPGPSRCLLD